MAVRRRLIIAPPFSALSSSSRTAKTNMELRRSQARPFGGRISAHYGHSGTPSLGPAIITHPGARSSVMSLVSLVGLGCTFEVSRRLNPTPCTPAPSPPYEIRPPTRTRPPARVRAQARSTTNPQPAHDILRVLEYQVVVLPEPAIVSTKDDCCQLAYLPISGPYIHLSSGTALWNLFTPRRAHKLDLVVALILLRALLLPNTTKPTVKLSFIAPATIPDHPLSSANPCSPPTRRCLRHAWRQLLGLDAAVSAEKAMPRDTVICRMMDPSWLVSCWMFKTVPGGSFLAGWCHAGRRRDAYVFVASKLAGVMLDVEDGSAQKRHSILKLACVTLGGEWRATDWNRARQ
ncbi:hypothetical protein BDZ89DRAFT_1053321 [Hymenopellis radicata]|nr:hypothetical protein BDZ89DRAFT_1053321 [Hymenopellis radicata]